MIDSQHVVTTSHRLAQFDVWIEMNALFVTILMSTNDAINLETNQSHRRRLHMIDNVLKSKIIKSRSNIEEIWHWNINKRFALNIKYENATSRSRTRDHVSITIDLRRRHRNVTIVRSRRIITIVHFSKIIVLTTSYQESFVDWSRCLIDLNSMLWIIMIIMIDLKSRRLRFENSENDHCDRKMWWFETQRNKLLISSSNDFITSSSLRVQELFCEFYLCVLRAMLSIDTMIYRSKFDLKWTLIWSFEKMSFFASFASIALSSWRRRKRWRFVSMTRT